MKGYLWLDLLAASDLKGPTKAVGYALAHFAGGNGAAWPSYDTLARAAGVSRYSAIKSLAILVERGMVTITPRAKENGSANSNLYLLTHPEGGEVVSLGDHLVNDRDHPERGGGQPQRPKLLTKETQGVAGLINAQAKRWKL